MTTPTPTPCPVAVVMGSDSDFPIVERTHQILDRFEIDYDVRVLSAHRTPHEFHAFVQTIEDQGFDLVIAAAGRAAHLAGVLASFTTLPVIAIPIASGSLQGVDALYSTIQMPSGIPVATMAIGEAGAVNAGVFAAEILALKDPSLRDKLEAHRKEMARGVTEKSERLRKQLAERKSASL